MRGENFLVHFFASSRSTTYRYDRTKETSQLNHRRLSLTRCNSLPYWLGWYLSHSNLNCNTISTLPSKAFKIALSVPSLRYIWMLSISSHACLFWEFGSRSRQYLLVDSFLILSRPQFRRQCGDIGQDRCPSHLGIKWLRKESRKRIGRLSIVLHVVCKRYSGSNQTTC